MPRHTEPSANDALGAALSETLPAFGVRSENTRQIVGSPDLRPDILIVADGWSPVILERDERRQWHMVTARPSNHRERRRIRRRR